jgi:hypothetical protein
MRSYISRLWHRVTDRRLPNLLDSYVASAPHPQNVLNIFKGEWVSRLPEPYAALEAGTLTLFDDARVKWAEAELGGFQDKTILDLGPLEGGHPYMFERMGAKEVVSIEGNTRAFLKCLATKELLGLKRVSYQCGDFMEYLREGKKRFDVVNASGVLYHQRNPAELLALVAKAADVVAIWTHYYDHKVISANPSLHPRFSTDGLQEYDGFKYQPYRQVYGGAVHVPWFCGGNAPYSHWMTRDDIIRGLNYFGLEDVRISFDDPLHANGPSFSLIAARAKGRLLD